MIGRNPLRPARVVPPILALIVFTIPASQLAGRLVHRNSAGDESTIPAVSEEPHTSSDRLPVAADSPPDIPPGTGTVTQASIDSGSREYRITATPDEAARLIRAVDTLGSMRSIRLERAGSHWTVDLALDPYTRDSRRSHMPVSIPDDDAVLTALLMESPRPRKDANHKDGEIPAEEPLAVRGSNAPDPPSQPFGRVAFATGKTLSWRWAEDVLVLEESP